MHSSLTLSFRQLRKELQIPSNVEVLFERYSDSAAAFVTLDPNQPSVYKQLYRAAKAKLKLRIKATIMAKEPTSAHQATVEDEIPGADSESRPSQVIESPPAQKSPEPRQNAQASGPRKIVSLPVAHTPSVKFTRSVAEIQRGIEDLMVSRSKRQAVLSEMYALRPASQTGLNEPVTHKKTPAVETEIPVARGVEGRRDFFAGLPELKISDSYSKVGKSAVLSRVASPSLNHLPAMETPLKQCPYAQANSSFTVFCNSCSRSIYNYHYHCGVCDDGDFDLCMDCTGRVVT